MISDAEAIIDGVSEAAGLADGLIAAEDYTDRQRLDPLKTEWETEYNLANAEYNRLYTLWLDAPVVDENTADDEKTRIDGLLEAATEYKTTEVTPAKTELDDVNAELAPILARAELLDAANLEIEEAREALELEEEKKTEFEAKEQDYDNYLAQYNAANAQTKLGMEATLKAFEREKDKYWRDLEAQEFERQRKE